MHVNVFNFIQESMSQMYQYMAIPKKTFGGNFPGPDQKVSMECQSVNVQFYKTVSVQEYTLVLWLN